MSLKRRTNKQVAVRESVEALWTPNGKLMVFVEERLVLHLSRFEAACMAMALDDDPNAPDTDGITVARWGESGEWLIDSGWIAYRISKTIARRLRLIIRERLLSILSADDKKEVSHAQRNCQ